MKYLGLLAISLFYCKPMLSQGIQFQQDTTATWQTILSLAKDSGKMIFVDVYTNWCGPCKRMDKDVFPLKRVGDVFNKEFINYKLNAEKGVGPQLARKFNVISYPTYLFVRGDGTLIYKARSAMDPDRLLQEAYNALMETGEPLTVKEMDSLYPTHKKDKNFMFKYLKKRTLLDLNNVELLDNYFTLLTKKEQSKLKNLQLVVENGSFLNKNLKIGPALFALLKNKDKFNLLKTNEYNSNLQTIIDVAREKTIHLAIKRENKKLLKLALAYNKDSDLFTNNNTIKLRYYWGTRKYKKYFQEAMKYIDKQLLVLSSAGLDSMDKKVYTEVIPEVDRSLASRKDLNKQEKTYIRNTYKKTQTIQVTNLLYNTSKNLLECCGNKPVLQKVGQWLKHCISLSEKDTSYFRNVYPIYLDTYASYFLKAAKRKNAIKTEQKAISFLKNYPENHIIKQYMRQLTAMKNE